MSTPMGDGEERKTPTRILEEEEAAHRQLSAQPSFSLSFLPSVLKSATIAITYYGSLISFTGSSHGRAHLTSSAIISICVYYVLPPSACSVAKSVKLIICEALGACPCACLLPSPLSLVSCLSAGGALILRLAPCGGAPMGAPGSLSQPPPIISLYLYKRSVIPFLFTILFTATRSLLPVLLSLLLLLVLSSRSSGRLSSRAGR